jgi:hypothetical protein
MTTNSDQFGASGNQTAQIADSGFGERPMNVGNIERLVSILAGAIGLLLLSRRLFVYVTLALLSAYLLFRGITGLVHARQYKHTGARRFDQPYR